jgi:hypothetical protein
LVIRWNSRSMSNASTGPAAGGLAGAALTGAASGSGPCAAGYPAAAGQWRAGGPATAGAAGARILELGQQRRSHLVPGEHRGGVLGAGDTEPDTQLALGLQVAVPVIVTVARWVTSTKSTASERPSWMQAVAMPARS